MISNRPHQSRPETLPVPERPAGSYLGRGDRNPGNLSTFGRIPRIDVKCPNWTVVRFSAVSSEETTGVADMTESNHSKFQKQEIVEAGSGI